MKSRTYHVVYTDKCERNQCATIIAASVETAIALAMQADFLFDFVRRVYVY